MSINRLVSMSCSSMIAILSNKPKTTSHYLRTALPWSRKCTLASDHSNLPILHQTTGKSPLSRRMAYTTANGRKNKKKGWEDSSAEMDQSSKGIGSVITQMEQDARYSIMEKYIKATGWMVEWRVKECSSGKMARPTQESGPTISSTAMGMRNGPMEQSTKEILSKASRKVTG